MNRKEIENLQLKAGDVLYVYLRSNVLKVGTFRGILPAPSPSFQSEDGLCIDLEPQGSVFEWLRPVYIKSLEIVAHTK